MPRTFRVSDGYSIADFLHYGLDNIAAAKLLLKTNARYFDSAGYLAHLGIELLLKAWHLHVFGQFEEGHKITVLWRQLQAQDQSLNLEPKHMEILNKIDSYFALRYPNPALPQEIGDEDLDDLLALENALGNQMPDELYDVVGKLSPVRKGGRVLMERPI
jgi:HEPN domain-containing protein